jgi:hypothetical protein
MGSTVMKYRIRVLLSLPLLLFLTPSQVWGSIAPSSVGLSLGWTSDLDPYQSGTLIPMAGATWRLADHVSIRSSVTYLQAGPYPGVGPAVSSSGNPRDRAPTVEMRHDDFVPLAAGIRLSVGDGTGRSHGFFIEVSPAAYIARFNRVGEPSTKLLAGFQAGCGMRVLALGASHAEFGVNYYRSEGASVKGVWDFTHVASVSGVSALAFYVTFGVGR